MSRVLAGSGRALLLLAVLEGSSRSRAGARGFDVGIPDLDLRFDNTLRSNVGVRTDPVARSH
jgi:hypothetical protein